jgi:flagellar FliJ protein
MQNLRYYFKTKRPEDRKAYRRNPACSIDIQRRQASTLQAMIAEVDHSTMALDRAIDIERERTGIRDRSHYAYPMSARTMETRRDNLKITRDTLAERLSRLEGKQFDSATT